MLVCLCPCSKNIVKLLQCSSCKGGIFKVSQIDLKLYKTAVISGIGSNTCRIDDAAVGIVSQSIAVYAVESTIGIGEDISVLKIVCRSVTERK